MSSITVYCLLEGFTKKVSKTYLEIWTFFFARDSLKAVFRRFIRTQSGSSKFFFVLENAVSVIGEFGSEKIPRTDVIVIIASRTEVKLFGKQVWHVLPIVSRISPPCQIFCFFPTYNSRNIFAWSLFRSNVAASFANVPL